jgi:hypothetical protein
VSGVNAEVGVLERVSRAIQRIAHENAVGSNIWVSKKTLLWKMDAPGLLDAVGGFLVNHLYIRTIEEALRTRLFRDFF